MARNNKKHIIDTTRTKTENTQNSVFFERAQKLVNLALLDRFMRVD